MTSNEKSILQAALDKLPDQRHQLMYSEAGSLKDEIERLQKELQGVRLGAEGMGWAPRSHVDGAYERGFAEGSGNEGYYQRTIRQLKEAIYWALGERGEFGAEPEPLAGKYRRAFWWRTELRKRSGLPISGQSSPVETSQPLVSWRLTDEHINSLQVASVDRLIKRAKAAHYVNVRVRINGDWEEHEADWIKHMKREGLTAPSPAPRDQLLRDAIDMCEGWSAHVGGIGQDTIAALREWLSELSAPTHAIGLPAGELTAEMLQIMKDNSDQIEQMRPEEPKATLGIKVVVDPSMPSDEIVMRGANGQRVRVTGLAIPDKASANTAICKTCCQEFELHDGHKCPGLAEKASGLQEIDHHLNETKPDIERKLDDPL